VADIVAVSESEIGAGGDPFLALAEMGRAVNEPLEIAALHLLLELADAHHHLMELDALVLLQLGRGEVVARARCRFRRGLCSAACGSAPGPRRGFHPCPPIEFCERRPLGACLSNGYALSCAARAEGKERRRRRCWSIVEPSRRRPSARAAQPCGQPEQGLGTSSAATT